MKIPFDHLVVLSEIYKSVPERAPSRYKIIEEYAKEILEMINRLSLPVEVWEGGEDDFVINRNNLMRLEGVIQKLLFSLKKSDGMNIIPIFIIPTEHRCCGRKIKIEPKFATPLLYDIGGVSEAKVFHGKCTHCSQSFYHGFRINAEGCPTFDDDQGDIFQFNSGIIYTWAMMRFVDSLVSIGTTTFEKIASVYQNMCGGDIKINPDRLENAWFIYRITQIVKYFPKWPRKDHTKELDIEELSRLIYPQVRWKIDSKWLTHKCDEIGCRNNLIVMDGNEKLYRYICGSDQTKLKGNKGEVNTYNICINNPIRGNDKTKPSKFCNEHQNGRDEKTSERIDVRPITRLFAKSIPSTILLPFSCKKEVDSFYDRTAGMFYIFRPCGIRLTHSEMYTAESLSSVFILMVDLFGQHPDPRVLRGVAYDRACGLDPFIGRLANEGNVAAKEYKQLDFMVDLFHIEGHTEKKCNLSSDECLYHPKLPKFEHYAGFNSEVAEQSFNIINPYKYSTRKMSYSKRLLFLKFIDDSYNVKKCGSLNIIF